MRPFFRNALLALATLILWPILRWLLDNALFDWFTDYLDKHWHIKEADLIASVSSYVIPLLLSALVVAFVYWLARQPTVAETHEQPAKLTYLGAPDYELGPAIIEMARGSAWGRWFAARELVDFGKPIDERKWYQIAASIVLEKLKDGKLVVRGRMHGQTGSEPIPQTDWRDIALYYFPDNRTLWKLRILPREGVTIQDDEVIGTDLSMRTVAHITRYDSLLVDSHQFETLWPRNEKVADSERRKFLKEARKRKLDPNAITVLSEPCSFSLYFRRLTP